MKIKKILLVTTFLLPLTLNANTWNHFRDQGFYQCKVDKVTTGNDNSILGKAIIQKFTGKSFIVDIQRGMVRSFFQTNKRLTSELIAYGSKTSDFKSILYTYNEMNIPRLYKLSVRESVKDKMKPFVFETGNTKFSGFCE